MNHSCINVTDATSECKDTANNWMNRVNEAMAVLQQSSDGLESREEDIHQKANAAIKEIYITTLEYVKIMEEEQTNLIKQVKAIENAKTSSNEVQKVGIKKLLDNLLNSKHRFKMALNSGGSDRDLLTAHDHMWRQYRMFENSANIRVPHENANISVIVSSANFRDVVKKFANISSSAFGPFGYALTEVVDVVTVNQFASFIVQAVNHIGKLITSGGDQLTVKIISPNLGYVSATVIDNINGTYSVTYNPPIRGSHKLFISFYGKDIIESPFSIEVVPPRDYTHPISIGGAFGSEGSGDNQFCRPWGICIGYEGQIIVGDRSNNRVKIHDRNGKYITSIGSEGSDNGLFNRPTGVACDKYGRIIVADKDNHRIQIFCRDHKFIVTFGEKGSKNGQFNYPWDVAINSKCQILVSDTRNHRIQLFQPNGKFIDKYGFDGVMWKQFDSPRGVAFTFDDDIVATDFNNHRILYIDKDLQNSRFIGCDGTRDGQFQRPQGVVTDRCGHVIVADGKNQRIQVFDKLGTFLCMFGGVKGTGIGQLDRPSGLCVSADNRIIVVDFGNNRIQMF